MRSIRYTLALGLLLFLFFAALGCGSGGSRELQSITLTSSPSGNGVQFIATGHYNQAPFSVSPLSALWAVYLTGGQTGPSITQSGLAQCAAGAPGSFSILVYAPANSNIPVSRLTDATRVVVATGKLTCP